MTPQTPSAPPALPEPILLGYKLRTQRPMTMYQQSYGSTTSQIVEVCSFGHTSWITGANVGTCYASEAEAVDAAAIAAQLFPEDEDGQPTDMYAYRVIPLLFGTLGVPQILQPSVLLSEDSRTPEPLDSLRFTLLGYDITEYSQDPNQPIETGYWPGCSPLSLECNGIALEIGTHANKYCLVDSVAVACNYALSFGVQQPEPGPYVIVEVWRRFMTME
jgi:hypothetical protein